MAFFEIQELIQPYPTIRKQTDDALVPDIICLLNQILHLLMRQTRQYYPGHLRRVNLGDGVVLDIALPVQPVAEGPNGAVIGILTVLTAEIGQIKVDIHVGKFVVSDKWLQKGFIELGCSRGDALPSGIEKLR